MPRLWKPRDARRRSRAQKVHDDDGVDLSATTLRRPSSKESNLVAGKNQGEDGPPIEAEAIEGAPAQRDPAQGDPAQGDPAQGDPVQGDVLQRTVLSGRLDGRETTTLEPRPSRLPTVKLKPPPTQFDSTTAIQPHPPYDPPQLTVGSQLGRYELRHKLGQGGMGVVFRAYDPKLDRHVALKVLNPRRLRPQGRDRRKNAERAEQARQRLLREAWALARLNHPNVVTVYDVGSHEDQVFLAMELIEGETLSSWNRHHRADGSAPPWRQVLHLMRQAGRGLAAAHDVGLVHRDFKPGNVALDSDGRVWVLDFGLARPTLPVRGKRSKRRSRYDESALSGAPESASDEDSASNPSASDPHFVAESDGFEAASSGSETPRHASTPEDTLTAPGALIGTPAYMAPEQRQGHTDARSDQYAFCISLYQLLYGELPPPPRKNAESPNARKALARPSAQVEDWQWPWRRPPAWLHRALLRGLETDPARRYPDMGRLLQALDPRPHLLRTALEVLLVVALVATGAWLLLHDPDANEGNSARSEQHFEQAREYVASGNNNLALTSLGLALHHAGLAGDSELEARSLLLQAQLQSQAHVTSDPTQQEAFASLERARRTAREAARGPHPITESRQLRLDRYFVTAQVHFLAGDLDLAEDIARRAVRLSEIWNGTEHPRTARQLSALALIERDLDPREARDLFRRALEIRIASLGADHPQTLRSHINLAHVLLELGQRDEARALLERALPRLEASGLMQGPSQELNAVHALLADLLTQEGDATSAYTLRRLELTGQLRLSGEHSYEASRARNHMAGTLLALDRPEAALPLLHHALATQEAELGDDHISLLYVLINLSRAERRVGDIEAADATANRALQILSATGLPPGHSLYQQLLTTGPEPAETDVEALWESLLSATPDV